MSKLLGLRAFCRGPRQACLPQNGDTLSLFSAPDLARALGSGRKATRSSLGGGWPFSSSRIYIKSPLHRLPSEAVCASVSVLRSRMTI